MSIGATFVPAIGLCIASLASAGEPVMVDGVLVFPEGTPVPKSMTPAAEWFPQRAS